MIIDAWNPKTFGAEITATLSEHSDLIFDYHAEDRKLMDEHLSSSPYQSLKSNRYFSAYQDFHEHTLAPTLSRSRIRAWHYTRLTDEEAEAMQTKLVLSSLDYLRHRLNKLVENNLLKQEDAETVFSQSPFHKQLANRSGQLCTTIIPHHWSHGGVVRLLENWGGESAYFWLSDRRIATTLKSIGVPRIVEIETGLSDNLNGYQVARTVLVAWARQLNVPVTLSGCDLLITKCIDTAKVMHIHTKGDNSFDTVATEYPEGIDALVDG